MNPDTYLEIILNAAGSSLRHYESYSKDAMRKAMNRVLQSSRETAILECIDVATELLNDDEAYAYASEIKDALSDQLLNNAEAKS